MGTGLRLRRLSGLAVVLAIAGMWGGGWLLQAQTAAGAPPSWETNAGGKMEFEVAAIHLDKGPFHPPSFALSSDDWFQDPNGRFHADFSLEAYIEFAYKTWLTGEERRAMLANLPSWVKSDRYAIEANAPLHATKDQYRLMMQSLLADRFGLKIHFESRDMPVLAMVLIKPGKTGPKLVPHEQGPGCEENPTTEVWPPMCYGFMARPKDGLTMFGSRATSMQGIGKFLGSTGGMMGEISRPVVDETGLKGTWDFTLEIEAPFGPKASDAASAPDGPTLLEGMQEQLGIKLKTARAVIAIPVVDHVERPSEN